jgi:hypothetical protein
MVVLVSDRRALRGPDDLPGEWVTLTQIRDPVTTQNCRDCPSRQPDLGADPVLATAFNTPQLNHLQLDLDSGAPREPPRTRRTIDQAGLTLKTEPGHPSVRALARNPELLSHVRDRATIIDYPGYEQTTTMNIQTGISVGHEDLLGQWLT